MCAHAFMCLRACVLARGKSQQTVGTTPGAPQAAPPLPVAPLRSTRPGRDAALAIHRLAEQRRAAALQAEAAARRGPRGGGADVGAWASSGGEGGWDAKEEGGAAAAPDAAAAGEKRPPRAQGPLLGGVDVRGVEFHSR